MCPLSVWQGSKSRGGGAGGPAPSGSGAGGAADGPSAATGVLSDTLSQLMGPPHVGRLGRLNLTSIMRALLERHFEVTGGMPDEGDAGDDEEAREAATALADVHACIELIMSASMRSKDSFESLM